MAANLKTKDTSTPFTSASTAIREPKASWSIKLGLPQVVLLWSSIAVMMVLVFFFGLYAGREQGAKIALEEQGAPVVRLPLAAAAPKVAAPAAAAPVVVAKAENFDFSQSAPVQPAPEPEKLPTQSVEASVGFLGRSANDLPTAREESKTLEGGAKLASREAPPAQLREEFVVAPIKEVPKRAEQKPVVPQEPVAKKPTKVEPKPEAVKPSGSWFVQVAAVGTKSEAQSILSRMKATGVVGSIREAKVNNLMFYRVLAGPFNTRDGADVARTKLSRASVGKGDPFVKNLGQESR